MKYERNSNERVQSYFVRLHLYSDCFYGSKASAGLRYLLHVTSDQWFVLPGPGEALFQSTYFELLKKALRSGGLLSSQGQFSS